MLAGAESPGRANHVRQNKSYGSDVLYSLAPKDGGWEWGTPTEKCNSVMLRDIQSLGSRVRWTWGL